MISGVLWCGWSGGCGTACWGVSDEGSRKGKMLRSLGRRKAAKKHHDQRWGKRTWSRLAASARVRTRCWERAVLVVPAQGMLN